MASKKKFFALFRMAARHAKALQRPNYHKLDFKAVVGANWEIVSQFVLKRRARFAVLDWVNIDLRDNVISYQIDHWINDASFDPRNTTAQLAIALSLGRPVLLQEGESLVVIDGDKMFFK